MRELTRNEQGQKSRRTHSSLRSNNRWWYPRTTVHRGTRVHRRSLSRYERISYSPDHRDTDIVSGVFWLQWKIRDRWIQWGIHGVREWVTKKTLEWESPNLWIYRNEWCRAYRLAIWWIGSLLPRGEHDPRIHIRFSRSEDVEKSRKNGRRICGDAGVLRTISEIIHQNIYESIFTIWIACYMAEFIFC